MSEPIILTPEELLVLADVMEAEYISYAYIAAMKDIQSNYLSVRTRCIQSLGHKGILRQKLSGETAVQPAVRSMMENLFFGGAEGSLNLTVLGENSFSKLTRFHYGVNGITMVSCTEGRALSFAPVTEEEIEKTVRASLGKHFGTPKPVGGILPGHITRIVQVNYAKVGVGSAMHEVFEQDGGLYFLNAQGFPEGIRDAAAAEMLSNTIRGE